MATGSNGPCRHLRTEVVDSRRSPRMEEFSVVRRRKCLDCGIFLPTREVIDSTADNDRKYFYKIRYDVDSPTSCGKSS